MGSECRAEQLPKCRLQHVRADDTSSHCAQGGSWQPRQLSPKASWTISALQQDQVCVA